MPIYTSLNKEEFYNCKYLGGDTLYGESVDVYVVNRTFSDASIIIKQGNEPWQYLSYGFHFFDDRFTMHNSPPWELARDYFKSLNTIEFT